MAVQGHFLVACLLAGATLVQAGYVYPGYVYLPPPADLGLHHRIGMTGQSRLLLNPFSIFGNPTCEYQGAAGVCYGEVECLALAGQYGNFCPGLQGLCCLFYRTCGQRTSQEVSYFQNVQYPLTDRPPENCPFEVVKRSDEFCGLKVDMEQADFPTPHAGQCDEAAFHITGIKGNTLGPKCGRLTGSSYTYDISRVERLYVNINSSSTRSVSWKLKVTQVLCKDFDGESITDVGSGGITPAPVWPPPLPTGSPVFPPPLPTHGPTHTTSRPTTSRPIISPPAPPTGAGSGSGSGSGSGRCGIRGPPFNQGTRNPSGIAYNRLTLTDRLEAIDTGDSGSSRVARRRRKKPNRRPGAQGPAHRPAALGPSIPNRVGEADDDNSVLRSDVWAGPNLNDTLFAHYAGKPAIFSERITFGQVSGMREFPWQVAMEVNGRFHCGGSVIGEYWVLTAAHCVKNYERNPSAIKLYIGDWDLGTTADGPSITGRVAKVMVHPSYAKPALQNDIAVLKLTNKLTFNERISAVCLPTNNMNVESRLATVSGWGRNEAFKLQKQLHHLSAIVANNDRCDNQWNRNGAARGLIVPSMLCMDASNGDSCNGDSGGPTVIEEPEGSGRYVQIGVVSFGSGTCTEASLPGVYTRTGYYKDWIQNQMV